MAQQSKSDKSPASSASLDKQNPEALATFAATARNDGERPKDHPDHATPETAAIPANPKVKDEAATQVLKAGVEGKPQKAQAAVDKVPDRTRSGKD
jgi:hypothetical protein